MELKDYYLKRVRSVAYGDGTVIAITDNGTTVVVEYDTFKGGHSGISDNYKYILGQGREGSKKCWFENTRNFTLIETEQYELY